MEKSKIMRFRKESERKKERRKDRRDERIQILEICFSKEWEDRGAYKG